MKMAETPVKELHKEMYMPREFVYELPKSDTEWKRIVNNVSSYLEPVIDLVDSFDSSPLKGVILTSCKTPPSSVRSRQAPKKKPPASIKETPALRKDAKLKKISPLETVLSSSRSKPNSLTKIEIAGTGIQLEDAPQRFLGRRVSNRISYTEDED